jgi:hypothetical protein
MSAHRKAWAFYDAVQAHSGGCQCCGDDDEFSPDVEAFEETGELLCSDCWTDEARMYAEDAATLRLANPIEPGFRRLGQ